VALFKYLLEDDVTVWQLNLLKAQVHEKQNHSVVFGTNIDVSNPMSVACSAITIMFVSTFSVLGCNSKSPVPRFKTGSWLEFIWLFVLLSMLSVQFQVRLVLAACCMFTFLVACIMRPFHFFTTKFAIRNLKCFMKTFTAGEWIGLLLYCDHPVVKVC
jgi:hypothetical protein